MHRPLTPKTAQDYDSKVYARGVFLHDDLAMTIMAILNPEPKKSLLDVGCGGGHLLKLASERGLKTYGIDSSKIAVRTAKTISSKSKIILGSAEQLPFKKQIADYVTCIGSLEHIPDMNAALREMVRVLKPEGKICIYVPNKRFIGDFFRKKQTHGQEIERFLTYEEWKSVIEYNGLEIIDVYKDNPKIPRDGRIAGYEGESGIFFEFKKMAYTATRQFIPFKFSFCFCFVCTVR